MSSSLSLRFLDWHTGVEPWSDAMMSVAQGIIGAQSWARGEGRLPRRSTLELSFKEPIGAHLTILLLDIRTFSLSCVFGFFL